MSRKSAAPHVTVVYPYFNNPGMMKYHLQQWSLLSSYVRDRIEFIVVDDGSKEHPLQVPSTCEVNLRAYVIHDEIMWNVGGAKNLGANQAQADWLFITDMDRQIPEEVLRFCIDAARGKNEDKYYMFKQMNHGDGKRRGHHLGTLFVNTKKFWESKGFDETLSGNYGFEDGHLLKKLSNLGLERIVVEDPKIIAHDHNEDIPDSVTPEELRGDRHYNCGVSRELGTDIPAELEILRFEWSPL
jgi:glycosyltransferase involved in cell wall biosynthesis